MIDLRNCRAAVRFSSVVVLWFLSAGAMADEPRVPLSELGTAQYRGESGGLYGDGLNEPPAAHRELAERAIASIRPLDERGQPAAGGKIVLLSVGMSNATQEFSAFIRLARNDRRKRPELLLVDGAQGSVDANMWADGRPPSPRLQKVDPWAILDSRLSAAGASPAQVQAAWFKHALIRPERYGEFPGHADALEEALVKVIHKARERFPNLRIVFLSSRTYAGYATRKLNPEPYAYESAFAVRSVIQRQIDGDDELNADVARGAARAPVLLWGPYLWANGQTPRKSDGLVWLREDFREDGTHPSGQGRRKVAEQLLNFFTSNEFARAVFLR
jgi:hypothetical protein